MVHYASGKSVPEEECFLFTLCCVWVCVCIQKLILADGKLLHIAAQEPFS